MGLKGLIQNYLINKSGNFSLIFAVSTMCLLIAVGTAIDIASVYKTKSRFQDVADATVIMAVRSGETAQGQLSKIADAIVKGQVGPKYSDSIKTMVKVDGEEVTVSITGKHEHFLMGMIGKKQTTVTAESVSIFPGHNRKNIAFVLDTTQSMTGAKMSTLQKSMKDFLVSIEPALAANNSMVSIVPFADYVRIPTEYETANWINIQPPEQITYNVLDGENSVNCRTEGTGEGQYTVCDSYVYIEEETLTSWKGCMGSRPGEFHKIVEHNNRDFPGFNGSRASCLDGYNFLEPLTSDISTLEQAVDDLTSAGFTYIPSGLIWGWRTLSPSDPFPESFGANEDTENLLVLMTDGANSMSLDVDVYDETRYHWGQASSAVDGYEAINAATANPLTRELCDLIKADDIEIATVAFEVSDSETLDMLRDCASSAAQFYDAQNASEFEQAFQEIGRGQNEIRIVR